jgi:hypothetical protein
VNTVFPPDRLGEIRSLFKRMFSLALQKVHERCSEDPSAVYDAEPLAGIMVASNILSFYPELYDAYNAVLKCLTFELRFESTIVVTGDGEFSYSLLAEKIRIQPQGVNGGFRTTGEGPLRYTAVRWPPATSPCTVTETDSNSTLKVRLRGPRTKKLVLEYDPGTPRDSVAYHCPATPVLPPLDYGPKDWWFTFYSSLHGDDRIRGEYPFQAVDWILTGQKAPFAIKSVARPVANVQESTTFTLVHKPE